MARLQSYANFNFIVLNLALNSFDGPDDVSLEEAAQSKLPFAVLALCENKTLVVV